MKGLQRVDYDPVNNYNFLRVEKKINLKKTPKFNKNTNWYDYLRGGFELQAPDYRIYNFETLPKRVRKFKSKKRQLIEKSKLLERAFKKELIIPVLSEDNNPVETPTGEFKKRPVLFIDVLQEGMVAKKYALEYLNSLQETVIAQSPEYQLMIEMLTSGKVQNDFTRLLNSVENKDYLEEFLGSIEADQKNINIIFPEKKEMEEIEIPPRLLWSEDNALYTIYIEPVIKFGDFMDDSGNDKLGLEVNNELVLALNRAKNLLESARTKQSIKREMRNKLKEEYKIYIRRATDYLLNTVRRTKSDITPKDLMDGEDFYYNKGWITSGESFNYVDFFVKVSMEFFYAAGYLLIPRWYKLDEYVSEVDFVLGEHLNTLKGLYEKEGLSLKNLMIENLKTLLIENRPNIATKGGPERDEGEEEEELKKKTVN
jgi:hypothetical protein